MEVKWNPEEGRSIYLCETQTIYSLIALCTDEITVLCTLYSDGLIVPRTLM